MTISTFGLERIKISTRAMMGRSLSFFGIVGGFDVGLVVVVEVGCFCLWVGAFEAISMQKSESSRSALTSNPAFMAVLFRLAGAGIVKYCNNDFLSL
jgi:hypothetical protein